MPQKKSKQKKKRQLKAQHKRQIRVGRTRRTGAKEGPSSINSLENNLRGLNKEHAASVVGSLLMAPELSANAFRLEKLLCHILHVCSGDNVLSKDELQGVFGALDTIGYSRMEDPAEDIFIGLAMYEGRNYRILEGLWEGNTFYLQRLLDVVSDMPTGGPYEVLRKQIFSLLTISEAVAEKCNLKRYSRGAELPALTIPEHLLNNLDDRSRLVRFSNDDLDKIGVDATELEPFCCQAKDWIAADESLLQSRPLLLTNDGIIVLAPSYISPAIRIHILGFAEIGKQLDPLRNSLSRSYTSLFERMSLLGGSTGAPVRWQNFGGVLASQLISEYDPGRYLHFIFLLDDFHDPDGKRLEGLSTTIEDSADFVMSCISKAIAEVKKKNNFRQGVSIISPCGWGRSIGLSFPRIEEDNWSVTSIGAYNLNTLSMVHGMNPLDVFRLVDHERDVASRNVELINWGGFLNLYGFARHLGHELLPHDHLDAAPGKQSTKITMMVPDSFLLDVRCEASEDQDLHIALPPSSEPVTVQRYSPRSYFGGKKREPLYGSRDDVLRKNLKAIFESDRLNVWLTASVAHDSHHQDLFTLWESFVKWLPKLVPAIEKQLPNQEVSMQHWHINFSEYGEYNEVSHPTNESIDDIESKIRSSASRGEMRVDIDVPVEVMRAFHQVDNHAEIAVLKCLTKCAAKLLGITIDATEAIRLTVPSPNAKQLHVFVTKTFSGYVSSSLPDRPTYVSDFDETFCRIGMANRSKSYTGEKVINGRNDCCKILNESIASYWEEIRHTLRQLNRTEFLTQLLQNMLCVENEGDQWGRTTRAMLDLEGDSTDTRSSIARQMFKRSSVATASRHLLEMAICECPRDNGYSPGKLDLSRLLASLGLMFELGGWSDAIHTESMGATLTVSPYGLIKIQSDFFDEVMAPFGQDFASREIDSKSNEYDSLFEPNEVVDSINNILDPQFLSAWDNEFGFSPDAGRQYLDDLEDFALSQGKAVLEIRKKELLGLSEHLSPEILERIIDTLTLHPRDGWDSLVDGLTYDDIVPWRFRRKWSSIRRPMLRLSTESNPLYLIAPSFVRQGFGYLLHRTYTAEFDDSQFSTDSMKSWIGHKRDEYGHQFNIEVCEKLNEIGWEANPEIKLNDILGTKLDQDYGDIDVLAWQRNDGRRVLAIECKDLMFPKTPGEVARQLSEFRGAFDKQGRPDRLKRHLQRIDVLTRHIDELKSYLNKDSINLETILVFKHPAPIAYSKAEALENVQVTQYDHLDRL